MLEEVEMTPLLHAGVVYRAVGLAALGTGEAPAAREVDLDVEPLLLRIEPAGHHHPRRHQAEGKLEEIGITHDWHSDARDAAIVPTCSRSSRRGLEAPSQPHRLRAGQS